LTSAWTDAFGIQVESELMFLNYLQRPDGVQALVGWHGKVPMPRSQQAYGHYGNTLNYDQRPLRPMVFAVQNTYAPLGWPSPFVWFPLVGNLPGERPDIRGFPGIKRTGMTTAY
jgi:hypothetical protein